MSEESHLDLAYLLIGAAIGIARYLAKQNKTGVYSYNPRQRRHAWFKIVFWAVALSPLWAALLLPLVFGLGMVIFFGWFFVTEWPILWIPVGITSGAILLGIFNWLGTAWHEHEVAQAHRRAWGRSTPSRSTATAL